MSHRSEPPHHQEEFAVGRQDGVALFGKKINGLPLCCIHDALDAGVVEEAPGKVDAEVRFSYTGCAGKNHWGRMEAKILKFSFASGPFELRVRVSKLLPCQVIHGLVVQGAIAFANKDAGLGKLCLVAEEYFPWHNGQYAINLLGIQDPTPYARACTREGENMSKKETESEHICGSLYKTNWLQE